MEKLEKKKYFKIRFDLLGAPSVTHNNNNMYIIDDS